MHPVLQIDKRAGRSEDHGLVIRSFNYLFCLLQDQPGINYVLKASFLEIYNEKVHLIALNL